MQNSHKFSFLHILICKIEAWERMRRKGKGKLTERRLKHLAYICILCYHFPYSRFAKQIKLQRIKKNVVKMWLKSPNQLYIPLTTTCQQKVKCKAALRNMQRFSIYTSSYWKGKASWFWKSFPDQRSLGPTKEPNCVLQKAISEKKKNRGKPGEKY